MDNGKTTFKVSDKNEELRAVIDPENPIRFRQVNGADTLTFISQIPLHPEERILFTDRKGKDAEYIIKQSREVHQGDDLYFDIFCENSFYETIGDWVEDKRPTNATATAALQAALATTRWEVGKVEDLGLNTTNFYRCSAKEAVQKKIVPVWDCEFETDIRITSPSEITRKVNLKRLIGEDNGKRFEYTKDIEEVERIIDTGDLVTALYGYGKGEELNSSGYGRRINFSSVNGGKSYVENTDARKAWGRPTPRGERTNIFGKVEFDEITDKNILLERTKEKLKVLSTPKITYKVKAIDLLKYGYDFEGVSIGDVVAVIDKDLNLRVKARVVELREFLNNEELNEITLGNYLPTTSDVYLDTQDKINSFSSRAGVWDKTNKDLKNLANKDFLDGVIDRLNREINGEGGYVYISDDGRGIVTLNRPKDKNPTKAVQISGGGIRLANSKNSDGSWNWRTLSTGDGIVADEIITGTLTGGNVKWNLNDGTLLIGKNDDNYLLKFDGTTLKFGVGTIKKDDLSPELKEELKGRDGQDGKDGERGPKGEPGVGLQVKKGNNLLINGDFSEPTKMTDKPSRPMSEVYDMWVLLGFKPGISGGVVSTQDRSRCILSQYRNIKGLKADKLYYAVKAKGAGMTAYIYAGTDPDGSFKNEAAVTFSPNVEIKKGELDLGEMTLDTTINFYAYVSNKSPASIDWVIVSKEPIKGDEFETDTVEGLDPEIFKQALPPALQEWNDGATNISGKWVFTPNLFVGSGSGANKSGVWMGQDGSSLGMFGYRNGTRYWAFNDDGTMTIGKSGGKQIKLLNDGSAKIPKIESEDISASSITAKHIASDTITASEIKSNTITARELASDAITTDILYPGRNQRIVLGRGYSPGSNNAPSVDANGDAIRLKYNAGNYFYADGAVSAIYNGGREQAKADTYASEGLLVRDGRIMVLGRSGLFTEFDGSTFKVVGHRTLYMDVDSSGARAAGWYSLSDVKLKENIKPIDRVQTLRANPDVHNKEISSDEIYKAMKTLPIFTYNYKEGDLSRISTMTQSIKGDIREYLVRDKDGKSSIDLYGYISLLHVAFKEEVKRNDELEKRIEILENKIKEMK